MSEKYHLSRVQLLKAPLRDVAAFFEEPRNLGELTPPFLHFRIRTEGQLLMETGGLIDYTIRLHGFPMLWRTEIVRYTPGVEFVDVQVRGPYKFWHHLHTFRETEFGTEIADEVTYELPLGPLGRFAHGLFVRRQLETIFDYRAQVVAQKFGAIEGAAGAGSPSRSV